jgi:hypothetical protein
MQRTYRVRNKNLAVDELPDVLAVRASSPQASFRRELVDRAQEAFERSGWQFVPSSLVSERGARTPSPWSAVARIFRRPTGQLVLNANRASAKFRDDVARAVVDTMLGKLGAHVVASLPVARNLFTIEVDRPRDVFEVLTTLNADPRCEFAEPDFVEALGGR